MKTKLVTDKELFEFDKTVELQEKLDNLCKKWGLSEDEVIGKIIEIESAYPEKKDTTNIIPII